MQKLLHNTNSKCGCLNYIYFTELFLETTLVAIKLQCLFLKSISIYLHREEFCNPNGFNPNTVRRNTYGKLAFHHDGKIIFFTRKFSCCYHDAVTYSTFLTGLFCN